jgi:hypothetical protein
VSANGSLLNKKAVKHFILAKLESKRPHLGITRVGGDVYDQLDARLRAIIIGEIERHPSIGKTFKLG